MTIIFFCKYLNLMDLAINGPKNYLTAKIYLWNFNLLVRHTLIFIKKA
jgi:hypothetical protein